MKLKLTPSELKSILEDHFNHMNRPITQAEWDEFTSDLDHHLSSRIKSSIGKPPQPPRRGRPPASDSSTEITKASYEAALNMQLQLTEFKHRNGVARIPRDVTDAILEDVMKVWPAARKKLVREYVRENKKYFAFLQERGS